MRRLMPRQKSSPGKPAPPPQVPSAAIEKKVWVSLIEKRPAPKEAEPYMASLKPVFAAEGLPEQLFWLAEVESGFNPSAKSPAGASGSTR